MANSIMATCLRYRSCYRSYRIPTENLSHGLFYGPSLVLFIAVSLFTLVASGQSVENDSATQADPIDFSRQIIPLLTKAGCNSGACHGAAAGRGYLALSLYGSRPQQDYETLLFAQPGRFVDTQQPVSSLLIQKPSGYLDHGGDVRIDSDSREFAILRDWIAQAAPPGSLAELQGLHISTGLSIESQVGESVAISATADWRTRDGEMFHRDVTPWLVVEGAQAAGTDGATVTYVTRDPTVLELTAHAAGYWPITLRVGPAVSTLQLWVRNANAVEQPTLTENGQPASIDALVAKANARVGNRLEPTCEPHILVRRWWIDLLGRQPTVDEWTAASAKISAGKSSEVVDALLTSAEFSQHAARQLASWVARASRSTRSDREDSLSKAIAAGLGHSDDLRQLVYGMLVVDAPSADPGLLEFHHFADDARTRSELIANVWMGVRVGCAQCHDHPLDHWTQDDYFSMAACWAEIEPQSRGANRIAMRTTTDLRSGRSAVARLPGDSQPYADDSRPVDVAFADWLCNSENPQFSRNLANRLWQWLIGVGLIEDVDDQRSTNPAVNPELLDYLAATLVRGKFSLRPLVREIVLSQTYARASRAHASNLDKRLVAARTPKSIDLALPDLAAQALGVARQTVANGQESESMMAAVEPGCARGQPCNDPLSDAQKWSLVQCSIQSLARPSSRLGSPNYLLRTRSPNFTYSFLVCR
ncbi:MAG: DUF1553 domain-containing protein [Pirellulaceae bacterium]